MLSKPSSTAPHCPPLTPPRPSSQRAGAGRRRLCHQLRRAVAARGVRAGLPVRAQRERARPGGPRYSFLAVQSCFVPFCSIHACWLLLMPTGRPPALVGPAQPHTKHTTPLPPRPAPADRRARAPEAHAPRRRAAGAHLHGPGAGPGGSGGRLLVDRTLAHQIVGARPCHAAPPAVAAAPPSTYTPPAHRSTTAAALTGPRPTARRPSTRTAAPSWRRSSTCAPTGSGEFWAPGGAAAAGGAPALS